MKTDGVILERQIFTEMLLAFIVEQNFRLDAKTKSFLVPRSLSMPIKEEREN